LPNPTASTLGGIESLAQTSHQWINSISTSGVPAASQPAFGDISGTVGASQLPMTTTIWISQANGQTTGMGSLAQNQIELWPIYISSFIQPTNIGYYITTADNTSNSYDFGLYGPGCSASASSVPRAAHTGTLAGTTFAPSSAHWVQPFTATPSLTPGIYCVALTSNASSPAAVIGGYTATTYWPIPFTNGVNISGGGSSLPSTITAPATNTQWGGLVWIAFY
jgi:hypothetical protein